MSCDVEGEKEKSHGVGVMVSEGSLGKSQPLRSWQLLLALEWPSRGPPPRTLEPNMIPFSLPTFPD